MPIFDPAIFWSKVAKSSECWMWKGLAYNKLQRMKKTEQNLARRLLEAEVM